tara:strand:+ start:473 stop:1147 length:675 start_codon:yes stop_codon:yes gene_type:complete
MTIAPLTDNTAAIVAEFGGQQQSTVDHMIGVGVVKDSEAVYFKYEGDDQTTALVQASGKPVTRIGNVVLTGITIDDDVYKEAGFDGSKLNVFLQTQQGTTVLLTSGLTTIWSQCLITSLMGLYAANRMGALIAIDTWKGTSKMRPCFAAVRDGATKVTNSEIYEALKDARSDRAKDMVDAIMRDSIELLAASLNVVETEVEMVANENEIIARATVDAEAQVAEF